MKTWQGWAGPLQYGHGPERGLCVNCKAKLSRYNPHTMCGPCRRSLVLAGLVTHFARRKSVGRGPLLPETLKAMGTTPAELPEPEDEQPSPLDPIPAPGETHG